MGVHHRSKRKYKRRMEASSKEEEEGSCGSEEEAPWRETWSGHSGWQEIFWNSSLYRDVCLGPKKLGMSFSVSCLRPLRSCSLLIPVGSGMCPLASGASHQALHPREDMSQPWGEASWSALHKSSAAENFQRGRIKLASSHRHLPNGSKDFYGFISWLNSNRYV